MKKYSFALLTFLACFSVSQWAQGATFNITNDSDTDCSDLSCNLSAALLTAGNNGQDDVLIFAAGTYDMVSADNFLGQHAFNYSPAASENHSLTLQGAGVGATILDGTVTSPDTGNFFHADLTALTADDQAGITIQHLSFRNANNRALSIHTNAAPVVLQDCEFKDNQNVGSSAIDVGGASLITVSGDMTISSSSFANNASLGGWQGGGAFYTQSGNVVIRDNRFIGNSAKGTAGGFAVETDSGELTITNNVVSNNSANYVGGVQVYLMASTGNISNNTIVANTATVDGGGLAIDILDPVGAANVYNNIVFDNTAGGNGADVFLWENRNAGKIPATVNLFNNDFITLFSTCLSDAICAPTAKTIQSGNQNVDPLLVDPANGDFHLQASSTVIDQGLDTAPALPTLDFEGDNRIVGAAPDLGADEFNPPPPPDTGNGGDTTGNNSNTDPGNGGSTDGGSTGGGGSGESNSSAGGCSLIRTEA